MTPDDRSLERAARRWIEDGPTQAPDRAVDAALLQIQNSPQERDLRIPWRLPTMFPTSRVAALAVIGAITLGAGFYLLRPQQSVGTPVVTPGPSLAGLSSPRPTATDRPPVAFSSTSFAVPLSMSLVDGWRLEGQEQSYYLELRHRSGGGPDLGIMRTATVTVPGAKPTDPYIPLPADLAAWLSQRPEFGPITTREITVGGRKGTQIDADFTYDGTSKYSFILYYPTAGWLYDRFTVGTRGRWIVLPGAGDTGVLIFMESGIGDWDATSASLDQLLATLTFR